MDDLLPALRDEFGLDLLALPPSAVLDEDIGVDSLALMELLIFLEDALPGLVIDPANEPRTVADLTRLATSAPSGVGR